VNLLVESVLHSSIRLVHVPTCTLRVHFLRSRPTTSDKVPSPPTPVQIPRPTTKNHQQTSRSRHHRKLLLLPRAPRRTKHHTQKQRAREPREQSSKARSTVQTNTRPTPRLLQSYRDDKQRRQKANKAQGTTKRAVNKLRTANCAAKRSEIEP
jgi:hypothetical protein